MKLNPLLITSTIALIFSSSPLALAGPDAATTDEVITLEANLKVPAIIEISAEQMKEASEIRKAHALAANLKEQFSKLEGKPGDGREKLLDQWKALETKIWDARMTMKQGISIDLIVQNTGASNVSFWHSGDHGVFDIVVTGPGALNLPYPQGHFEDTIFHGDEVTIKANSSETITLDELKYGKLKYSRWLIDKPGDYTVTVSGWFSNKNQTVSFRTMKTDFKVVEK